MNGINFMKSRSSAGFDALNVRHAWVFTILWALSPSSVQVVAAAQVCSTTSDGKITCHNKLSGGVIAAIVVTIFLVILICVGIFFVVRRTRAHRLNPSQAGSWTFGQPELSYNSRRRGRSRRDAEEGDNSDDDSDDEKYLSVEKNQILGPTWEARYDPSSAPLPGKSSSGWSRLRGTKSGSRSGSDYGSGFNQPSSAPGVDRSNSSSSVKKPRSAGSEQALNQSSQKGGKRHWGNLVHGSTSKISGPKSAPTAQPVAAVQAASVRTRSRQSPGLYIIAEGPGGFYNAPVIPPITPHTPRTPSRLGTAPPLSAGYPVSAGYSQAMPPRTPRTANTAGALGQGTPLTPRPMQAAYMANSPVTPRAGALGAI